MALAPTRALSEMVLSLGLTDNYLGYIIPAIVAPYNIILVKTYIESIPASFYPFTAPSIMPSSKYRCMNGYTSMIGMTVTMEMVYLMTLLLKTYIESIPASLEESATIDGATTMQVFIKIILPLSKPIRVCVFFM